MNTIAGLLRLEDICLNTRIADKPALLCEIGGHMEHVHGMQSDWVVQSLTRREQVGSTALGDGIAIPHARVRDLDRIQVAYFRVNPPIPFDAPDAKPVTDVLVLLVPKQATDEHLELLADASQMFADRGFRRELRRCADPSAVKQLFDTWRKSVGASFHG